MKAVIALLVVVSIAKGGYLAVDFVENGKLIRILDFPTTAPAAGPATWPVADKPR